MFSAFITAVESAMDEYGADKFSACVLSSTSMWLFCAIMPDKSTLVASAYRDGSIKMEPKVFGPQFAMEPKVFDPQFASVIAETFASAFVTNADMGWEYFKAFVDGKSEEEIAEYFVTPRRSLAQMAAMS